ncbi:hypothetical protein VTK56DRAFT_1971 [Thermocarpiscus australiensis]
MPTDTTSSTGFPTITDTLNRTGPSGASDSAVRYDRTLVITLSSVLSVVGLLLIAGTLVLCWRYRQGRLPYFQRDISPIDEDEIATWKAPRDEKDGLTGGATDVEAGAAVSKETGGLSHVKHASTNSVKKPPSVIVYANGYGQGSPQSTDAGSPRYFTQNHPVYGKMSFEKALPQTPIQARAPNSRAGLTDESVPGDEPFLPSPKRNPSRLYKSPPCSAAHHRGRHGRTRSSRSSTRSFGEYGSGGSDMELSPRHSHDQVRFSRSQSRSHSRVYSSSSVPPGLSSCDEALLNGLSPTRPLYRENEIGRAIG